MNRIKLVQGDITRLDVDAIVNAANSELRGGGGVDGAIHRAAGPGIMEECRKIGGCPTGDAVVTSGGKLKAKFIIHAVGPIWTNGSHHESELLANAYRNSLNRGLENQVKTIAFPNISTGIYGFPKQRAGEIAIEVVTDFLKHNGGIEHVIFCCFDEENYDLYKGLLKL